MERNVVLLHLNTGETVIATKVDNPTADVIVQDAVLIYVVQNQEAGPGPNARLIMLPWLPYADNVKTIKYHAIVAESAPRQDLLTNYLAAMSGIVPASQMPDTPPSRLHLVD